MLPATIKIRPSNGNGYFGIKVAYYIFPSRLASASWMAYWLLASLEEVSETFRSNIYQDIKEMRSQQVGRHSTEKKFEMHFLVRLYYIIMKL